MSTGREILTLQLGHYANYVGAHWWNIQESSFTYGGKPSEINHDVLFREGLTPRGEVTFTPRLVLVDLKGSLGHLRIEGDLYDVPEPNVENAPWPADRVQVEVAQEVPQKNKFLKDLEAGSTSSEGGDNASMPADQKEYNLEDEVKVWADFLVPRFHPQTVMLTNEYQHSSEAQPFDVFNYGVNVWKGEQFEEELTNRIRFYMEECDNAQGFHLLVDGTDGFGGIASELTEYLADEYHSKSMLAVPLLPPQTENATPVQEWVRTINLALTLQKLSENASLVAPLGTDSMAVWRRPGSCREFPHLKYKSSLPYHTSAILAAALDTVSMRYRLRDTLCRMSDMVDPMSRMGRRVVSGNVNLPFALHEDAYLMDTLENWEGPLWTSITPHCNPNIEDISQLVWMQSVGLQGVPRTRLRGPGKDKEKPQSPAHDTPTDILADYLRFCSHVTFSHVTCRESPCKVATPFPNIFKPCVSLNGDMMSEDSHRLSNVGVKEVPVLASLMSCDEVGHMLESLHSETTKIDIRRFPAFSKAGLEADDYKESQNQLQILAECYEERYEI